MKIALLGVTGNVGIRLLAELLRRAHEVTGIARHPDKVPVQAGVTLKVGDVRNEAALSELLRGHDAVVHAVKFQSTDVHAVIDATKKASVPRLLVVGGAGTLEVAAGLQLVDTPDFPESYKGEALAGRDFLNVLRAERDLDWTFLSPSAEFAPGKRTGKFRLGGDQLLTDENGQSRISMEDFAIALVDELEKPRHSRRRFTVGY
jgi:putative NADH-flavin reductase